MTYKWNVTSLSLFTQVFVFACFITLLETEVVAATILVIAAQFS